MMNDFTKTDLKEIYRCLKYMTKGGTTPYSCHTIGLVNKVRTMIESYDSNDDVSLLCKFTNSNHILDPDNRICMTCHKYVPIELTKPAIHFTQSQIDHICYQIGEWYQIMKPLLEGQHNLGYMKEKLKTMICG
jgi:hypothetical protein